MNNAPGMPPSFFSTVMISVVSSWLMRANQGFVREKSIEERKTIHSFLFAIISLFPLRLTKESRKSLSILFSFIDWL